MKLVYTAGPYRAKTEYGVKLNIDKAEKVALAFWKKGYSVICPHKNTAFFGGAVDEKEPVFGSAETTSVWLEGDFEMIRRCDAIVLIPGWEKSTGSVEEYKLAKSLGKEIIVVDEDGNEIKETV
jgi:hypothetical protein